MKDQSNPQAFPLYCVPGDINNTSGMELRDWFAGMALQGVLSAEPHNVNYTFEDGSTVAAQVAESCYEMAEAMLKARAK